MKISLCLITKDEERNIQTCINSVKTIVNEIIVVDTGSKDNTVNIAKSLGAQVYTFEWINDFSKARNYALSKATGDWVIFLDADEYISDGSIEHIRECINQSEQKKKVAILSQLINLQDDMTIIDVAKCVRIFKRSQDIFYIKPIHERVTYKGGNLKAVGYYDEIKIYHKGYSSKNMEIKDKKKRNLEILLEVEEKSKQNSEVCYYIAQTYSAYGNYEKVLEYTKKVEKYNNLKTPYVYIMNKRYQLEAVVELDKEIEEVQIIYREAIEHFSEYPDYDYIMGRYELKHKNYNQVIKYFNQCIEKLNRYEGIAELQCIGKIAEIYEVLSKIHIGMGNFLDAVTSLVNVLKYNKYNVYAAYNLIDILCKNESAESIHSFLLRIYDVTHVKDIIFLMKIVNKQKQYELGKMLEEHLDENGIKIWQANNN